MNTLTSNFRITEEILSSSPADLVSASAAISTIPLRCASTIVAERLGANGPAVVPVSTAH